MSMSLLLGWGAYARDKNTSARLCTKMAGGGGGGEERICGTLRTPSFEGLLLKILCANVLRALRTHWSYVTRVSTQ